MTGENVGSYGCLGTTNNNHIADIVSDNFRCVSKCHQASSCFSADVTTVSTNIVGDRDLSYTRGIEPSNGLIGAHRMRPFFPAQMQLSLPICIATCSCSEDCPDPCRIFLINVQLCISNRLLCAHKIKVSPAIG